ncbi:hypothetical protein EUGRSUZ_I02679 [Eucalyptus grandis]|uniref:Uncharacterized protein n=2 Tax=Eucalyptus grandis TaxID=71139 RepID=A0ACC3JIW7_EUCGR|nr:hypothetical protein EUGRSUZ_I02679 [Eucalyptus grandis]
MEATKICLLLFALAACVAASAHGVSSGAPPPGVDCSTLVLNMADCLSFVSNGSTTEKPEGTCCSGLKTVLKADAECICEAFKSSAQLGVVLNVTKALSLPAACKVSASSATNVHKSYECSSSTSKLCNYSNSNGTGRHHRRIERASAYPGSRR